MMRRSAVRSGRRWPATVGALLLALAPIQLRVWSGSGFGLEGRIFDVHGEPVADVWVEARSVRRGALDSTDFAEGPAKSTRSSRNGGWSLDGLGGGTWLVTAVASETPRTDAELQELARPGTGAPTGVAITRLVRHVDADAHPVTENLDLGMALGASADKPVAGHLAGAFDPKHYAYQVTVTPFRASHVGPGSHTVSVSSSDPSYAFSAVPAADGSFALGHLDVGDYDMITVDVLALSGPAALHCQVSAGQFLKLGQARDALDIQLPGVVPVELRIASAASGPAPKGRRVFGVWSETGGCEYAYRDDDAYQFLLPEGTYVAQAWVEKQEFAAPLVPFAVSVGAPTPAVSLTLAPCPSFTVQLIDQHGQPLPTLFLGLGTPDTAKMPNPCRVHAVCRDGSVSLEHIMPGTYDVEFRLGHAPTIQRKLDLKPGVAPITVEMP